jgi:hypothetical protein
MRTILSILMGAAVLSAVPAAAKSRPTPEARLAKALEGRVAGEPVDCVNLHQVRSSRIIDRTAILYDAGHTVYVNRPRAGAEALSNWDIMVTRPNGSRLCSIDTVQLYEAGAHMPTGLVFLGEFVPYRKTDR